MTEVKKNRTPLIVASVVLAAGIFLLDLSLPLGVAGGVPYVAVVLISLWLPTRRDTLIAAVVCTVLTILGFYLSRSGSELWIVILNRVLAIFAIWTTAILSLNRKRTQEELRKHRDHLEELVAERTKELRRSEERFKDMFNYMSSGVAVYDAMDDGKDFAFVDFNTTGQEIEKVAAEDVIGKPVTKVFPGVEDFGLLEVLRRVWQTGEPEYHSAGLYEDDRVQGWRENYVYRIPSGEVVTVYDDVTERKHNEEERLSLQAQLRQSQKMEAVGQLAGGVAHDFNNLLQAILGYGDLALEETEPDDPVRRYIEEMLETSERGTTLVSQLLAFSRRQALETQDIDLNGVVANLMKMIQRVIGEHIKLNVLAGPDLGTVRADPGQIEQILMNLCVNARDAMPEGGTITIETENVRLDEAFCESHPGTKPGQYALLSVTDTGCGMGDKTLDQIFDAFFTTKAVDGGTGLGLATVYGLVKQHQGVISVYSEIDKGTVFKICLPVVERPAAVADDKIEEAEPGGTETILLAEDEEVVRNLTESMLERAGYTVLSAIDGEEALRVFEEHADKISLVLLDVVMPKLGGRAVFERIHEDYPQVRALFTSGYSINALHARFGLDEDLAFIQKPYLRFNLLQKIRELLDT